MTWDTIFHFFNLNFLVEIQNVSLIFLQQSIYSKKLLFFTPRHLDPIFLVTFFVLIALSAFFSGTEIALMTISKHAIQSVVRQKKSGAKSLEKIKSNTDKLLITILIGNNIVNVASSALATVATINMVAVL